MKKLGFGFFFVFFFFFFLLHSSVSDAFVTEVSPIQVKVYISFSASRSPRDVGIVTSYFNHGRARLGFYEGFFLSQNLRQRAPYWLPSLRAEPFLCPFHYGDAFSKVPGLSRVSVPAHLLSGTHSRAFCHLVFIGDYYYCWEHPMSLQGPTWGSEGIKCRITQPKSHLKERNIVSIFHSILGILVNKIL